MASVADLRAALDHPNVVAFGRVVRAGESHESDDEAYAALYGWKPGNGRTFTDFTDHPRQAFRSSYGWTSAAGAYQAMVAVPGKVTVDTWGDFVRWCEGQDYAPKFGQADQDLFFAWCLQRRGALPLLFAGRVREAIAACDREWASLPGSPYGQPTRTLDQALATYARWGGTTAADASAPAPVQAPAPPAPARTYLPPQNDNDVPAPTPPAAPTPPEQPMIPELLTGLASALINGFAPLAQEKITKELARHTDKPEVAAQVSATIVAAAQAATGKTDPIEAVAAAKASPEALQQVQESALDAIAKLAPVLDRLASLDQATWASEEASRAAAAERAHADATDMGPMLAHWAVGGLYGCIVLLGIIAVAQVIVAADHKPMAEVMTALVGLIMLAAGTSRTVYDYRFGSSRQSAAKDAVIGELTRRR